MMIQPKVSPQYRMPYHFRKKMEHTRFWQQRYQFTLIGYEMTDICLAYEGNFVILAYTIEAIKDGYSYILVYSPRGDMINRFALKYDPNRCYDTFHMLKNDEIIVPFFEAGQIRIISLRDYHKQRVIKFSSKIRYGEACIFTFSQSNLICVALVYVQQKTRAYKLIIRHYRYRGTEADSQIVSEFQQKYNQKPQIMSRRLDNSSKVCWITIVQGNRAAVCILSLNNKMEVQLCKAPYKQLQQKSICYEWQPLWDMEDNRYICKITNTAYKSQKIGIINITKDKVVLEDDDLVDEGRIKDQADLIKNIDPNGKWYEEYYDEWGRYDASEQELSEQEYQQKWLKQQREHHEFCASARLIDFLVAGNKYVLFGFGPYEYQRSYQYQTINFRTESDIRNEVERTDELLPKLYFEVGWNSNLIIRVDVYNERSNKYHVTLNHTLIDDRVRAEDLYMFLLLEINEDFDDDLLSDAIGLMINE